MKAAAINKKFLQPLTRWQKELELFSQEAFDKKPDSPGILTHHFKYFKFPCKTN